MNKRNLPIITPEQRAENMKKAAESKKARVKIKEDLKSGVLKVEEVLNNTKDRIIGGIKVSQVFHSLPKVGKKKAEDLLMKLNFKPDKKLSALKEKNVDEIKELLKDR